jgi:succinate-semialdehyde dehydrogenase / glutarate-semialdehyde dehydrogenase
MAEALAAGCSLIIKPAEETPTPGVMVHEALIDAGLPAEAVATVYGNPDMISRKLLGSGVIRKLSFTGSVPVGKHLAALACEHLVKSTLELGGHAPTIVFDDVNVEPVARMLAARKARNSGQVCNAPTRFYVHADVYSKFRDEFTGALKAIRIGDPQDQATQMGPLINEKRLAAIESIVEDSRREGAKLVAGGNRIGNQGYFHELTVLDEVPDTARIMYDEPFGPVAAMQPFNTLDEVIEKSNRLPFGLAAYAFTASRRTLDALSADLEVGLLGLNHCDLAAPETPFGGMKDSGYGSEGGLEGVEGYLVTKFVTEASPVGQ